MSRYLNPLLIEVAARDGSADPDNITYETFEGVTHLKAMLHGPESRVRALAELDEAISNDATPLRDRAQLLNLKRGLARTHAAMCRAGK